MLPWQPAQLTFDCHFETSEDWVGLVTLKKDDKKNPSVLQVWMALPSSQLRVMQ